VAARLHQASRLVETYKSVVAQSVEPCKWLVATAETLLSAASKVAIRLLRAVMCHLAFCLQAC
jgi:hypothetical protein